jgi:prophage regulatory protein
MKFLTLRQVSDRVGLSKTTIYKLIREDRFPRPVRVTSHAVRWIDAKVKEWQRSR